MSKDRDRIIFWRDDGKWANKRNNADKASSLHDNQSDATDAARGRKNGDILLVRSPRPRAAAWIVGAVSISTDCHVTVGNDC